MAIAAFSTVSDGLEPNQKERGHYIVDVNLEDTGAWIPYAEGVWVQLCRFNVTTGGFTVVLKGLPGAKLWSPLPHGYRAWFYAARSLEVSGT
jgi:2,4'-dihydroxyacetophenone dioxygenase